MIEIQHLQKVVGAALLVDIDVLKVASGEAVAVLGPAGCGKEELLQLLAGQSRPTFGMIRIVGLDPLRDRKRLSAQVGILFTENGLYVRQSSLDNLLFHCRLRGLPASRASEVLEEVGLADQAATQAGRLPPGLARRLAFGRILLHRPRVLILMEPFRGLDIASTKLLTRLVSQQIEKEGTVLILSTEGSGLGRLCQTIYTMEQGRLLMMDRQEGEQTAEITFRIPARQEGRVVLVNPADILFASAEGGQASLMIASGPVSSHLPLNELELRLKHNGFFRAHRGYLVNLQRVKAIIPYTRDSYTLILDDAENTEIPLSKSAARELRELLGY